MPSLMRFLTVIAVIVAAALGGLFALANLVTPRTREMTVTIPSQRLKAQPVQATAREPKTAGASADVPSAP